MISLPTLKITKKSIENGKSVRIGNSMEGLFQREWNQGLQETSSKEDKRENYGSQWTIISEVCVGK